jgi:tetratricopeptide (TPR) repeat protein
VDLYAADDFPGAIKMLEKAASIDPNYAPTWAHLGRAYTTNASLEFGGRKEYAKAQAAYEKAIALDPELTEVRVFMANLLTDTGQVEDAVPLMRTLLAEYPAYAEAHWELGYAYRFGGMLHDAVTESERARQNNPTVKLNSAAMNAYLYLGEYDKFLQNLPTSDSVYILFYRGFGEYYLRRWADAARDFDRAYGLGPTVLPARVGKALSDGIQGEPDKGLELLHATERQILDSGVSDAEGLYKVAQAYAVLGDKASAMLMFHRTIEGGFFPYPYFASDPLLENIRNEPEFAVLMREAEERHEQFKKRFF